MSTIDKHIVEKHGLKGLSINELDDFKTSKSKRVQRICDSLIFWKRMCGFE